MMKIEKLTVEQEAYLPVFREKWRNVGLRTDPINREGAVTAVVNLYKAANLKEPQVLFFSSPIMCLLARAALNSLTNDGLRSQLRSQLWSQLRSQLESQLESQLGSQLWSQLGSQLWSQLWSQLGSQLWSQLWSQLGSQLESQLWSQLGSQLGSQLRSQLWSQLGSQLRSQLGSQSDIFQEPWTIGGQDAYWISFYEFGRFIGAKYSNEKHFNCYIDYVKSCGWMFAYDQIALVSDRPNKLSFDERGLLHNETDQSVGFSDGWGLCSWHGLRVPNEWILDKKSLTADIALTHDNVEQRRAACEIVGWSNVLQQLNAKTIDKHSNPAVGELIEVDLPDNGPQRFLKVMCGTKREFALPVKNYFTTAIEAQRVINHIPDNIPAIPSLRT